MVTVQFNFKTIIEAQEFLSGLPQQPVLHTSGYAVTEPKAVVLNPEATAFVHSGTKDLLGGPVASGISLAPGATNFEKKKRGPKPKEKAEPVKEYGIEDCRTALSNLFDVKGREVAKSVLTEFKVDRVTYLKPEQFAAFIERCNAASAPE